MTERERKILMGESIEPRTANENAYANASGGGQEPLALTLVPDSAQNPFIGALTGATGEEIQSAWYAGRNVIVDFTGVASMAVNSVSSNGASITFAYTKGNNTYLALLNIDFEQARYSIKLFSGLTPVS